MDDLSSLYAISPVDGRYKNETIELEEYFSEFALIKNRIKIELLYLLFLSDQGLIKSIKFKEYRNIKKIINNLKIDDAIKVKSIEKETKHDVKAVEYFIQEKLTSQNIDKNEYIHIGLTSEDVNSLSYSFAIRDSLVMVILPALEKILMNLKASSDSYKEIVMLARTHGQSAVPTTLGKELSVFNHRIYKIYKTLKEIKIEGKINGAVGNYNAHNVAFDKKDWITFSKTFVSSLGLETNIGTTQILPADNYVSIFRNLQLINSILIGFSQDLWRYISDGYLKQQVDKSTTGSSTMPQKINPIDFENAEGNLSMANAVLNILSEKLPISRLQRDLSDSTVKRNIGVSFAYSLIAYKSILRGLDKISPDTLIINDDLDKHWEVITEGLQTILRKKGENNSYEKLKEFSMGVKLDRKSIDKFINTLDVEEDTKKELKALTPFNYYGIADQIVDEINSLIKI